MLRVSHYCGLHCSMCLCLAKCARALSLGCIRENTTKQRDVICVINHGVEPNCYQKRGYVIDVTRRITPLTALFLRGREQVQKSFRPTAEGASLLSSTLLSAG
jgi:hypothetical protein